jgi:hypothetical protein
LLINYDQILLVNHWSRAFEAGKRSLRRQATQDSVSAVAVGAVAVGQDRSEARVVGVTNDSVESSRMLSVVDWLLGILPHGTVGPGLR